jgi:tetratricopeptide (TPR) repeat protein
VSNKRKHAVAGKAQPQPARPSPRRRRRWVLVTLAVVAGTVAVLVSRPSTPPLPPIATAQLDPDSAALIQSFVKEVHTSPRSGPAWGRLGAVLRCFDYRQEARACLAQAELLDPKDPRWPYFQVSLLHSQAPQEAEDRLRRTVALCGNEPPTPRLQLARLLGENGCWAEAEQQLQGLLRDQPDNPPALLILAYAAQARRDLTNAVALAKRCTASPLTARSSWLLLGSLQTRLGDTNGASVAMRKAAMAAPDLPLPSLWEAEFRELRHDARSLSDQAQQYLMAKKPDEAAPLVQRLVQDHPQFSETWLLLGRQKYLQKQAEAAEQALRRHLELEPNSVNGHFQLGMALLAQSRWLEAATAFEKATALKGDFGPAFFNLGFALVKAGQQTQALAPFREAIRHNPEHIDSYILLADLSLQLGHKQEAAELARQASAVNPEDRRLPVLREKIARQ